MNLEHKIKLWNHLATEGNLMCSAAWYESAEQAQLFYDLIVTGLHNPHSNDMKELHLLQEAFTDPGFLNEIGYQPSPDGSARIDFLDIGSGTGHKAQYIFDLLPPGIVTHTAIDSSVAMLNLCAQTIRNTYIAHHKFCHRPNYFIPKFSFNCLESWDDRLEEFYRSCNSYAYLEAFKPTLKTFSKVKTQIQNLSKNSFVVDTVQSLYNVLHPHFPEALSIRDGLKGLNDRLDHHIKTLTQEIRKIEDQPAPSKNEMALDLRKRYHPGLVFCMKRYVEHLADMVSTFPPSTDLECTVLETFVLLADGLGVPFMGRPENNHTLFFPGIFGRRDPYSNNEISKQMTYVDSSPCGIKADILNDGINSISELLKFEENEISTGERPHRLVGLLGQTLGNFSHADQKTLLKKMRMLLHPKDSLLIGIEMAPHPNDPLYDQKIVELTAKYGKTTSKRKSLPDRFLRQTIHSIGIPGKSIEFDVAFENNTIKMYYDIVDPNGLKIHYPVPKSKRSTVRQTGKSRVLYLPHGSRIDIAHSYKFDQESIHHMLDECGYRIKAFSERDYALILAKRK